MSTADLKQMIDARTSDERLWIATYLLEGLRMVPEFKQTAEELAELARRRADLEAGQKCVTQQEAETRWSALESQGEL